MKRCYTTNDGRTEPLHTSSKRHHGLTFASCFDSRSVSVSTSQLCSNRTRHLKRRGDWYFLAMTPTPLHSAIKTRSLLTLLPSPGDIFLLGSSGHDSGGRWEASLPHAKRLKVVAVHVRNKWHARLKNVPAEPATYPFLWSRALQGSKNRRRQRCLGGDKRRAGTSQMEEGRQSQTHTWRSLSQ